jgi:RimJ/RimL family protein N-acetyltransferase
VESGGQQMRDALQPDIQSERLILRAWRPSDAEALFALFNNWEVVRWLSVPPWPYVINDARSYIDGAIHRSSEDAEESYAVTLHTDVVGAIGVRLRPKFSLDESWIVRPHRELLPTRKPA